MDLIPLTHKNVCLQYRVYTAMFLALLFRVELEPLMVRKEVLFIFFYKNHGKTWTGMFLKKHIGLTSQNVLTIVIFSESHIK